MDEPGVTRDFTSELSEAFSAGFRIDVPALFSSTAFEQPEIRTSNNIKHKVNDILINESKMFKKESTLSQAFRVVFHCLYSAGL